MKHSIKIKDITKWEDGWIGVGEVIGAKEKCDVIGFRIHTPTNDYWGDLTISEALALASNLTMAINRYLIKHKKYIPNENY